MDIIKMARELGAAIQQDERYLNFKKAREANEADKPLNDLIGELNLIQMNYQQEAQKEEPSEEKMQDFDQQFRAIYAQVMQNPNMVNYEVARKEVDGMMNYLMQILTLCVNGEDPAPVSRRKSMIAAATAPLAAAADRAQEGGPFCGLPFSKEND